MNKYASPSGVVIIVVAVAAVAFSLGRGKPEHKVEPGCAWHYRWEPAHNISTNEWNEYVCDGVVVSIDR